MDLQKIFEDFKTLVDSMTEEQMKEITREAERCSGSDDGWCFENKLEIPFGNYKIVATISQNGTDTPQELIVSIVDKSDVFVQDICLIRPSYHFSPNEGNIIVDNESVDCMVRTDPDDEDFTHGFTIDVHKEAQE